MSGIHQVLEKFQKVAIEKEQRAVLGLTKLKARCQQAASKGLRQDFRVAPMLPRFKTCDMLRKGLQDSGALQGSKEGLFFLNTHDQLPNLETETRHLPVKMLQKARSTFQWQTT